MQGNITLFSDAEKIIEFTKFIIFGKFSFSSYAVFLNRFCFLGPENIVMKRCPCYWVPFGKTVRFVNHVFRAYLDYNLSDITKLDQKTRAN